MSKVLSSISLPTTQVDVETALRVGKYEKHDTHMLSVQVTPVGQVLTYCHTCRTIIEVIGNKEEL